MQGIGALQAEPAAFHVVDTGKVVLQEEVLQPRRREPQNRENPLPPGPSVRDLLGVFVCDLFRD